MKGLALIMLLAVPGAVEGLLGEAVEKMGRIVSAQTAQRRDNPPPTRSGLSERRREAAVMAGFASAHAQTVHTLLNYRGWGGTKDQQEAQIGILLGRVETYLEIVGFLALEIENEIGPRVTELGVDLMKRGTALGGYCGAQKDGPVVTPNIARGDRIELQSQMKVIVEKSLKMHVLLRASHDNRTKNDTTEKINLDFDQGVQPGIILEELRARLSKERDFHAALELYREIAKIEAELAAERIARRHRDAAR